MELMSIHKGRSEKAVMVSGTEGINDDMVATFAMEAADESPESLFGWRVFRYFTEDDDDEDVEACRVYLHTD